MPSGSVIAKVKKRVIDTGRIFDICVQGAHRSDKIIFVIPEETLYPVRDGVETEVPLHECYFYLLYKRNGDTTTQIPKYLSEKSYDETTHMISVEFVPDATFTANEGSVQIQLFACDTQEDFTDTTVDIDEVPVWTTVNTSIMISKSQFKDKQVIVDENMFVKGIAEMSAYLLSAEGAASDAEEFAKGQRSDGKTVPQVTDSANDNAKWYKEQTQGYYNKVVSLETDIVALYNDKANLDAIAGDLTNIDTVATNIGDVNDVADDITKVSAVADDLDKIDDVHADLDNIDSVQAKLTEIETVSDDIANVNTVAGSISNVNTVAGDKTNIDTVAGISANVTTVAGISANVTTVAGISSSVTTVAGDKTNIDAVAGNKSNIDTVAGVSSSVNTVAGISSAVSAVAAVDDEVETVAGISSDVSAVAAVATDVASVADELTDIGTVADAISDVSAVAGIATDVSSVSAVASDVSAVADELTDIGTVASSISDVSAVADDISAVSAVADDLTNIDAVAADLPNINLKENVANKVTSISGSSTDTQYPSAKCVYTEVSNVKGAIQANTARIENLEQEHGGLVEVQYRGTNAVPTGKAKYAMVESIVGKSRAWNNLVDTGTTSVTLTSGHSFLTVISGTASIVSGTGQSVSVTGGVDIVRDLTLIFPEGVPSTVAECVQKCPDILNYDSYGYSLVDTEVEGVETTSINVNDEIYEIGSIDANGQNDDSVTTASRNKNYIPVTPSTQYFINSSAWQSYKTYNESFGYEGNGTYTATTGGYILNIGANVHYIRFVYQGTSPSNIQICLNSYADKTTYHPHILATLSLPSPVTLRSAGTVSEVLTLETGKKTRPIKTIDLGTDITDWAYDSNYAFFYTNSLVGKAYGTDFVCGEYNNVGIKPDPDMASVPSMSCATNGGTWFYIKNTSKSASDLSGGVASWLVGVKLNYALATPLSDEQVCDPIINCMIATEGGGTINTIQTQTTKIDNSMDVGYLAL